MNKYNLNEMQSQQDSSDYGTIQSVSKKVLTQVQVCYGCSSFDTLLPLVTARIEATSNRIHEGHTGRSFAEISGHLRDIEPLAAAAIALKVTFDKVFSSVDGSNKLQNVTGAIGCALEQECRDEVLRTCMSWSLESYQEELLAPRLWYPSEACCRAYTYQQDRCGNVENMDTADTLQAWYLAA